MAFLLVKAHEWYSLVSAGRTVQSNNFSMFYYAFTGVHLFHVLMGLIVLGVMLAELRRPARRRTWLIEAGAIYWHMVDLLWIILFALLYLMR
jgi:nitric oxide reductase NorE protein